MLAAIKRKLIALINNFNVSSEKEAFFANGIISQAAIDALSTGARELVIESAEEAEIETLRTLLTTQAVQNFFVNIRLWNGVPDRDRPEFLRDASIRESSVLYEELSDAVSGSRQGDLALLMLEIDRSARARASQNEFIFYEYPEIVRIFAATETSATKSRADIGKAKIRAIVDAVNNCAKNGVLIGLLVESGFLTNPDLGVAENQINRLNTACVEAIKQHVYRNRLDEHIRGKVVECLDGRSLHALSSIVPVSDVVSGVMNAAARATATALSTSLGGLLQVLSDAAVRAVKNPAVLVNGGKEAVSRAVGGAQQVAHDMRRAASAPYYYSTTLCVIDTLNAAYTAGNEGSIRSSLIDLGFAAREVDSLARIILGISQQQMELRAQQGGAPAALAVTAVGTPPQQEIAASPGQQHSNEAESPSVLEETSAPRQ